jgi:hypothetical protein
MRNSINTDKGKRGKKLVVRSWGILLGCVNLRLEAGFGFCLRLSFHRGTSFAGDLVGFLWG